MTTDYPTHPLPPKPKRYEAVVLSLSRSAICDIARHHEAGGRWRQAAAYWHNVSRVDERASLAIACSADMGDAWSDYRAGLPGPDHAYYDGLSHRAFGFRWLLANDCLREHFCFASDADPARDPALAAFLIEGMDLSAREDDLLAALIDEGSAMRSLDADLPFDRNALVARALERLHLVGADDPVECRRRLLPWVEVMVGLGHSPLPYGASREVVVLEEGAGAA